MTLTVKFAIAHTPAPWHALADESHLIKIMHSDSTSSSISGALAHVVARGSWRSEGEANANLIAAAPDMLEALRSLYDDISEYAKINNLGGLNNHSMKQARAAIAKAEGRS